MPNVEVFDRVRIKADAPLFSGERATVAYVGTSGISVYLGDSKFDDCIPLNDGEYELDLEG